MGAGFHVPHGAEEEGESDGGHEELVCGDAFGDGEPRDAREGADVEAYGAGEDVEGGTELDAGGERGEGGLGGEGTEREAGF